VSWLTELDNFSVLDTFTVSEAAEFLGFDEQLFRWCMNHTDPLYIVRWDGVHNSGVWAENGPWFYRVTLLEFAARLSAAGQLVTGDGKFIVDVEKIQTDEDLEIIERRHGVCKKLP
jgi:hypothetical protein